KTSEDEKIFRSNNKPINIVLDSSLTYLMAIRYSNHLLNNYKYFYSRLTKNIGFTAQLKDWNRGFDSYENNLSLGNSIGAGLAGIYFSLSVIYLLLFSFYSSKNEYLFYLIFTFSMGVVFLFGLLSNIIHSDLSFYFGRTFILPFSLFSIFLSILAFLYKIFYGQMIKIMRYLLLISILSYILTFFNNLEDISDKVFFGVVIVSSIEILRVIFLSIKRKKPNAWVIGAGVGFFAGFIIILFIIGVFFGGAQINNLYIAFTFLLSIPISMSVYLARSSAQTNENLEIQLTNVQKLSKEAIEQEKRTAKLELETQLVKVENERKTKELEEARQLQLSMLPKELPQLPNLDIAVYMQTATEVGGDYYDFHVGMDGTLTVVIGDATGHGLNAGTIVTATKSLFNSYAPNPDILFTLSEISRCIKEMKFKRLSMCLSLLKIEGNKLRMSAAGMPPALIYRNNKKELEEMMIKGMPLGATKSFPYELRETILTKDDTILLMSDGFPELFNEKKEMYGYERVKETFKEVANKSSEKIIQHLKDTVSDWIDGKDPDDDITFVVLKMK
ncbi:MAG: SpoIIE family protein phosphatase, partial [Bacteroidetes bacterium]|nr:SpoIIE family protein phosphatase [Bacteroidota bacterium]